MKNKEVSLERLERGMKHLEADPRINTWHFSILIALITFALKQQSYKHVKVRRRDVMTLSHIHTLPTYHKYFKELQDFGYITYRRSYHPGIFSEIDLLIFN